MFAEARELLSLNSQAAVRDAIKMFDKGSGIRPGIHENVGVTLTSYKGCRSLPLHIVRRVEYETLARILNFSEMEIGHLHDQFADGWYVGDVRNIKLATDYLMRATLIGNKFAKKALDWLSPKHGEGISTDKRSAREEYIRAIQKGDRKRAVELGHMLSGGELGNERGRADATCILQLSSKAQKAVSANNIGYLLAHGAPGIQADPQQAIEYYRMAIEWGSGPAASNLGFLYYTGAPEVKRDALAAQRHYMLAIQRGERNFAPRNLAILMQHGGPGLRASTVAAAHYFLLAIREGDELARAKSKKSLRALMRSWKRYMVVPEVRRQCWDALRDQNDEMRLQEERERELAALRTYNPYDM